ncbi:putative mitochondrial methylglutaconyl-CoA hydratase [Talaromyces proteolyticus]|uniref:Mitochondrial methylglutaconyl-CoA hydratase n=1 Tax=Talaromyces proteolyticus TaxID=1131652 RepID=A0AAD4PUU0_9EURO|nr:putative mitochondrial methylglutaconyl-CoA hydratase [Talaromyces proteolyticus]KAH8692639.1 putative mitochondrial methylglutaconyl-CoA hydratase [Talaromyces proteolyticus]
MAPRVAAISFSFLRPTPSVTRLQQPCFNIRIRASSTVGTSAEGGAINIQQVPAPGSGYVRVLLLNRPKARNAISKELLNTLRFHVDAISAEQGNGPTRALVIASNVDSAFCAGADLKERKGMTKEETNAFLTKLRGTFAKLETLPVPTISAISSVALGGGLELALCTHLRVFGSSSVVGLPETRLAIIPGAGGTYRLPKLIGASRARDLILTGRKVSGAEAYFVGLCNRLVEVTPEEEAQEGVARTKVLHEGIKLGLDICEGGPIAIKQAMQAVDQFEKGEEAENAAYAGVVETEDRLEALRAFAEKRKPVYRGR